MRADGWSVAVPRTWEPLAPSLARSSKVARMYRTVLFPTDGSDHAETVPAHALDVAATRDATLHALSVVDDRAFLTLGDSMVEDVRTDLETQARGPSTPRRPPPATAVSRPRHASPSGVRETTSSSTPATPTPTSSSWERTRATTSKTSRGSVSRRVVEESPVPVLTVGQDAGPT